MIWFQHLVGTVLFFKRLDITCQTVCPHIAFIGYTFTESFRIHGRWLCHIKQSGYAFLQSLDRREDTDLLIRQFMTHTKNSWFMNIDLGRCMQKRISFLRFHDQIIPFGLWLMRVICQLPMITYKPLMTGRAFQHLSTSFGLSSFYEHGMKLSAFWTVFKMELLHLFVGLDKSRIIWETRSFW